MVKSCSFCKETGHYINQCNNINKNTITQELEDKLYKSTDYESFKSTFKKFSKMDISLIAVKNYLPLNMSKPNYMNLFYEIYSIKQSEDIVIESEIFNIFNLHNTEKILNIYYSDKDYIEDKLTSSSFSIITRRVIKKYHMIFEEKISKLISDLLLNTKEEYINNIVNEIDYKITNLNLLNIDKLLSNNFIKNALNIIFNKKTCTDTIILNNYHSITDFTNINTLKNNLKNIYTLKIFKHLETNIFSKYEHNVEIINNKIRDIYNLNIFNQKLKNKISNLLLEDKIINISLIKKNITEIINNESNINIFLLYKNIFKNSVLFENINIIKVKLIKNYLNDILFDIQKLLTSKINNDENKEIIDKINDQILLHFSFKDINDLSEKIDIINLNYIKSYINKILVNENYFSIILLYYHFTSKLLIRIDRIENLYSKIVNIYLNKIIEKIETIMNSEYEENQIIEDIEFKLVNIFFKFYFFNKYCYTDIEININRIIFFILNKIFFNTTSFTQKDILLLYFKRIKNNSSYLDFNLLKKGTLFKTYINYFKKIIEKLYICKELEDINLNLFDNNIHKNIYYYYSLIKVDTINSYTPELMIDHLYIFKNNLNDVENVTFSINSFISLFMQNRYEFQYESIYHTKDIICEIIHDNNLVNIDCPICLEVIEKDQIVITNCNHKLCKGCLNNQINKKKPYKNISCCLCRETIIKICQF